jgi:predicted ester cyclase
MSNENTKTVEGYIEQVLNQKQLDRLFDFCSEDCVVHTSPYVGLGVNFDDTSGEKLILTHIAPHGPADGHLQLGDELIRVRHEEKTWESFDALRKGLWAQGSVGTEIFLTVRRHGSLITLPLKRTQIDQFDIKLSEFYETLMPYLQQYWPNLKMDIKEIFGDGDRVACYVVNHGTNLEYNRSATWGEIDIFKLKDGRIAEIWSVENTYSELKQLGYEIAEPIRETV